MPNGPRTGANRLALTMARIDDLNRLLTADPNDAFVLYCLAQEYAKIGDTPRSIEYFDRCITSDPNYCYAYYHKAKTLMNAGRAGEAVPVIQAGKAASQRAADGHALSELSSLELELE